MLSFTGTIEDTLSVLSASEEVELDHSTSNEPIAREARRKEKAQSIEVEEAKEKAKRIHARHVTNTPSVMVTTPPEPTLLLPEKAQSIEVEEAKEKKIQVTENEETIKTETTKDIKENIQTTENTKLDNPIQQEGSLGIGRSKNMYIQNSLAKNKKTVPHISKSSGRGLTGIGAFLAALTFFTYGMMSSGSQVPVQQIPQISYCNQFTGANEAIGVAM